MHDVMIMMENRIRNIWTVLLALDIVVVVIIIIIVIIRRARDLVFGFGNLRPPEKKGTKLAAINGGDVSKWSLEPTGRVIRSYNIVVFQIFLFLDSVKKKKIINTRSSCSGGNIRPWLFH